MRIISAILLLTSTCLAEPVMSPRFAELFPPQPKPAAAPMPSLAVVVPPFEIVKLNATYSSVAAADTYTIYSGTNSGSWPNAVTNTWATNVNFSVLWPEDLGRMFFVVKSQNEWGEGGPSHETTFPPLGPTHVIISWVGPRTNIFQTTKLPANWQLLTNSTSPLILPVAGNRFFTAGVRLSITGTNLNQ